MATSEDPLQTIIDTIPALVWSALSDGAAEFFNRRWLEYTGLSPGQALDWAWTTAIHPDDLDRLLEYWRSILASGEPGEIEARLRRSDGEYRWHLFRASPVTNESGMVIRWYGTNIDIDDRKRTEQALRSSEEHFRRIIDSIPGLVCTMTMSGELDLLNRQVLEYFGKPSEVLKNWATAGTVHPDDLPRVLTEFRRSIESGHAYEIEHRLRRADGVYRWFQARCVPAETVEGGNWGWYVLLTDIDDRKRMEDALRASEERFRLIVESIPGFVVTMTPDGVIELANRQILEYFGRAIDALRDCATGDAIHPDDRPLVLSAWKQSIEAGRLHEIAIRLRRSDGVYRWFQWRALPLRDDEGRILRWYTLFTDIDERKRGEEKLKRSEWNLLEAQRLGHSGSWSLDVASGVVSTSPEMQRVFDVRPDEDHSTPDFWINRIHPDDRNRVRESLEKCIIEKVNYQADYRLLLPDGIVKHQHSTGYPVVNEAGVLVEFVGTVVDTTQQEQARITLETAFAEIKELKDRLYQENVALREEINRSSRFEEIIGSSEPLRKALNQVSKVATTDSTVLIIGETGTGKELIARAIHRHSKRALGAFIRVNCAAIPPSLIASELFGHEQGAFTGAFQRRVGRFESANGGTIFLDEVGELPPETQIALLRVLQEREIERVGSNRPLPVDVRVLAATNRDLKAALAKGTLREDLFYRLNVFPIYIPSLRERADDIPLLIEHLVGRAANRMGKKIRCVTQATMDLFTTYSWPGNIRELQNVVERAVILCEGETLSVDETWFKHYPHQPQGVASSFANGVAEQERDMIEAALRESRGRIAGPFGAATRLGIPRQTLDSKIKTLGIDKHRFKG